MDDIRLGTVIRSVRQRRGWRQGDVAQAARVSPSTVSRAERGNCSRLSLATLRRILAALEISLEFVPRWRGGDVDRVVNAGHAAMHEAIAGLLRRTSGWVAAPEVSFSIYGERGVIDVLAWHGGRRVLLVIELKTHLADPQALVAQVDRYRRLAVKVARERGWVADTVSCWVVVAEGSTSRRRLAAHAGLLRTAFPADGRAIAGWLADPTRPLAALSFLSIGHGRNVSAVSRRIVRVRRPATPQG